MKKSVFIIIMVLAMFFVFWGCNLTTGRNRSQVSYIEFGFGFGQNIDYGAKFNIAKCEIELSHYFGDEESRIINVDKELTDSFATKINEADIKKWEDTYYIESGNSESQVYDGQWIINAKFIDGSEKTIRGYGEKPDNGEIFTDALKLIGWDAWDWWSIVDECDVVAYTLMKDNG